MIETEMRSKIDKNGKKPTMINHAGFSEGILFMHESRFIENVMIR